MMCNGRVCFLHFVSLQVAGVQVAGRFFSLFSEQCLLLLRNCSFHLPAHDVTITKHLSVSKVDKTQMEKILDLINSGKSQGAKLTVGGNRVGDKGYYVAPTVFADVQDNMRIATEEVKRACESESECPLISFW